jgi:hypothetical protein
MLKGLEDTFIFVRVETERQSAILQQRAFNLGYVWSDGSRDIQVYKGCYLQFSRMEQYFRLIRFSVKGKLLYDTDMKQVQMSYSEFMARVRGERIAIILKGC